MMDFTSVPVRDANVVSLQNAFINGLDVNELNMSETGIDVAQAYKLCKALMSSNITQLILNDNKLLQRKIDYNKELIGTGAVAVPVDESEEVSEVFVDMLKSCAKSIEYLGLWQCGISNTSIFDNPKVLSDFTELTEIILQANGARQTCNRNWPVNVIITQATISHATLK
ncbi:unnamed protein product [Mytilus edulis]|uniref:Uncharacterized protein n=1 Tax=Mytilus edulis TaxID=6550 RepID=A0A8S3Q622_MYTED|nr:unnamed protein product [Mytilus edulis]